MGLQASSACVYVLAVLILWTSCSSYCKAQTQLLPDKDFNSLLQDLRANNFFTAATVASYLARPYLQPRVTLLVPTDMSLAQAATIAPKDYPSLIKFHILEKNLNFKQLRLLPVGTWIPTALPHFGVQVTSNSAANFSLDGAQLISPNLCPSLVSSFISCQGISAILNPNSLLSPRAPLPPVFAGPPSSSASPPIFLPPSFSPLSPPSPSTSPSPSSSPSLPPTTSASPLPSPPTSASPSPFITPLPLAPSPFTSPPTTEPPSLFPPSLTTPPPLLLRSPGGLVPEPSPNAAASVSLVGASLMASIGAYLLVAL